MGTVEGQLRERRRLKGGCFLCAAATGEADDLVVARDATTITLLNRFPYNTGHLMVAPAEHVRDLLAAGDEGSAALMVAGRRAMRALAVALAPDGFNVGVNQGPPPAPAWSTSIFMSCPDGAATPITCRCWAAPRCCPSSLKRRPPGCVVRSGGWTSGG